ncbi:MAG: tRNA (N(6)-L-threonylcarbamoyladenosine(37)-C(2))-methylthiotransferase MtaB [Lachnospiraceae bacterium]|nr:tRNA (N(6)-L-threonylcarbamoyladenosine(37)-C(2))-methylthiotransferase MtaB [Lachnospiraceae bacterium]
MRAAFHTLGCKVNAYESQAILEQFRENGFAIVDFRDEADVYIVNTCSVTAEAARKSRQMLHRCKKKNPACLVAAIGCYAQEVKEELLADGSVDLVVGNNEKNKIAETVLAMLTQKNDVSKILYQDLTHCTEYEEQEITNQGDHVRAYVKIQDGCDRFCSYCIIPFLRGRSRSRKPEEIRKEVEQLADHGYQEIVLTGIDLSDYREEGQTLADMIGIVNEIPGILRIRISSLEERIITEDFLQQIIQYEKLCPHFHLSLQSGCDETLKRMNRHYTSQEYLQAVSLIRQYYQDPAITTDVIVGFPGETKEEFEASKRTVEKAAFSEVHVFPFSRRKGTKADQMPDQLTRSQKEERVASMMELTKKMQQGYLRSFLGKELSVLVEEEILWKDERYQVGFSRNYLKCAIPTKEKLINKIVTFVPEEICEINGEPVLAQKRKM